MDKMCRVCAADDIDFMDPDLLFFADALEHALRSGSLQANGNTGILSFERLAEVFRDWNRHSGIERNHALPPGGLDHGRADRGWLRRRRVEGLWKDRGGRQYRRCLKHVASGKLSISHNVRSSRGRARAAPGLHSPV
jgi:hypothetical protein